MNSAPYLQRCKYGAEISTVRKTEDSPPRTQPVISQIARFYQPISSNKCSDGEAEIVLVVSDRIENLPLTVTYNFLHSGTDPALIHPLQYGRVP